MCDRRLRDGLTDIISDTQSSFLRDKSIHNNNIRLVLDLLGYRHEMIESFWFRLLQGLLHGQTFIIITLEWFGFGEKCMNIIKLLYKFSFLAIQNIKVHWHKKRYSPGLVNLAELLAILSKDSQNVQPLNVMESSLVVSQPADDTTLKLLKSKAQIL